MASKTVLPSTVDQTSGGKFQTFKNLNNLKKTADYAESNTIHGKTKPLNRPATIIVSNFKASIPTGALITKITVKYKHSKVKVNNKDCNVQAPTITLLNGDKPLKYPKKTTVQNINVSGSSMQYVDPSVYVNNAVAKIMSKKGKAPTSVAKTESVSFSSSNFDLTTINSKDFKVKVDYPTNANENDGIIRLYYVQVIVTYKESKYSLSMSQISGVYNGDDYIIQLQVSNKNLTNYSPPVVITAPLGFSLKNYECGNNDKLTVNNSRTFTFTPKFNKKIGTATLKLVFESNISYASGVEVVECTFSAVEQLKNASASKTVTILKSRPYTPSVDPTIDGSPVANVPQEDNTTVPRISAMKGEEFYLATLFTADEIEHAPKESVRVMAGVWMDVPYFNLKVYNTPGFNSDISELTPISNAKFYLETTPVTTGQLDSEGNLAFSTYSNQVSQKTMVIMSGNTVLRTYEIEIYPNDLTLPFFAVMELSSEEICRLGHETNYVAQVDLKEITSEVHVRDWVKNFRIGVFNNAINENMTVTTETDPETGEIIETVTDSTDYQNLSDTDIFEHADYWSECPKHPNSYESLQAKFTYNKQYPVYVIVTGDYSQAESIAGISFDEPCIIEEDYYVHREKTGIYPVPINSLIADDGSTAELSLKAVQVASDLILSDFPLENLNDEDIAIRGLELRGTIESNTDSLIIYATLKKGDNQSRQRSLVLNELLNNDIEDEFRIGGIGDLWGFKSGDVRDLEDYEAILTVSNTLNNDSGSINFGNLQLIVYFETIEHQNIHCIVEDENLSHYGIFLQDVKIPAGLETDTDYLNIPGADVNDPFCQNIQKKTIELEFDIGNNCDILGSTAALQQLARLLTNERDEYNKPIPKRIEFSHYPELYWKYILESGFDNDLEISSYTVKVKLTIPAGVAYSKKSIITNVNGFVDGLTHVKPLVRVKPVIGSEIITVIEEISGQEFNIAYTNWDDKIVEIDCNNRVVLLKDDDDDEIGEDISTYADINVDWFRIHGEYHFTCSGGAIHSIEYRERW